MAQTAAQKAQAAERRAEVAAQKAQEAQDAADLEETQRAEKIAEQVKANRSRYKLIERNIHFTTLDDVEIVVPIAMKTKTYRAMSESGLDGFEQLMTFVFEPHHLTEAVDELDIFDTTLLVSIWYHEFAKIQEAQSLGE
jgi:hypothetical protein